MTADHRPLLSIAWAIAGIWLAPLLPLAAMLLPMPAATDWLTEPTALEARSMKWLLLACSAACLLDSLQRCFSLVAGRRARYHAALESTRFRSADVQP